MLKLALSILEQIYVPSEQSLCASLFFITSTESESDLLLTLAVIFPCRNTVSDDSMSCLDMTHGDSEYSLYDLLRGLSKSKATSLTLPRFLYSGCAKMRSIVLTVLSFPRISVEPITAL